MVYSKWRTGRSSLFKTDNGPTNWINTGTGYGLVTSLFALTFADLFVFCFENGQFDWAKLRGYALTHLFSIIIFFKVLNNRGKSRKH